MVGGGNLPSHFLGDLTEGMETVLGTDICVNHCGSGGNNGARFLAVNMYGRISMCI